MNIIMSPLLRNSREGFASDVLQNANTRNRVAKAPGLKEAGAILESPHQKCRSEEKPKHHYLQSAPDKKKSINNLCRANYEAQNKFQRTPKENHKILCSWMKEEQRTDRYSLIKDPRDRKNQPMGQNGPECNR